MWCDVLVFLGCYYLFRLRKRNVLQIECSRPWQVHRTDVPNYSFSLPKSSFGGAWCYALFTGVSRCWRLAIEKCFEVTHRTFRSAIENRRLGSIDIVFLWFRHAHHIPPKRKCGRKQQKMKRTFSSSFSLVWVLEFGYERLSGISKVRISSFVPSSKIFVWWA